LSGRHDRRGRITPGCSNIIKYCSRRQEEACELKRRRRKITIKEGTQLLRTHRSKQKLLSGKEKKGKTNMTLPQTGVFGADQPLSYVVGGGKKMHHKKEEENAKKGREFQLRNRGKGSGWQFDHASGETSGVRSAGFKKHLAKGPASLRFVKAAFHIFRKKVRRGRTEGGKGRRTS